MISWEQIHGAMTHFPIALLLFSFACDFGSIALSKFAIARDLARISLYGLMGASITSIGAVISGIVLTKGDVWGRGDLLWHHRFIWPAFGLLVMLSIWRLSVRDRMSRAGVWIYIVLMFLTSGLMAAAGYFGGELIIRGG